MSLQVLAKAPSTRLLCTTAEACFQAVLGVENPELESPVSQLQHFHQIQEQFPETLWSRRAGIRIGLILLHDDPAKAVPFFQAGLRDFPVLEDYFHLWLGEAWLKIGDTHQAAREFQAIMALEPSTILRHVAMMQSGHTWFQLGECQQGVPLLTQAVKQSPAFPLVPQAWFEMMQCALKEKNWTMAQQALQSLWVRHPQFFYAHVDDFLSSLANTDFTWVPSPPDYYQRAKTFVQNAQFQDAVKDLQHVLKRGITNPRLPAVRYMLAQTYVRLKQYKEAAEIFRNSMHERTSFSGKAAVWLGKAYLRQNEGQALLALGARVLSPWFSRHQKAEVLWMGGLWLEDHHRNDQALEAYRKAGALAGASRVGLNAFWQMGWLSYQLGAYQEAMHAFQKIIDQARNGSRQRQASFWTAQALTHLGKSEDAKRLYRQLANDAPWTYYGQLARSRVKVPVHNSNEAYPVPQASQPFVDRGQAFQKNIHYRRAMELFMLGLPKESTQELLQIKHAYAANDKMIGNLSFLFAKSGAYHEAVRMAAPLLQKWQARGELAMNSFLWPLAYPTGYLPIIREYATLPIDPYLVAGLIREESLYDPRALSRVGAMGLMQLMPETAEKVARRLGLSSAFREELFRPNLNIRLGTAYLGELLQQFGGKIIYAVAAYNAGPHVVNRWIGQFGDRDPEEFVEFIPYRETRRYVKRVLTSYHVYRGVMTTRCSMISIDTGC